MSARSVEFDRKFSRIEPPQCFSFTLKFDTLLYNRVLKTIPVTTESGSDISSFTIGNALAHDGQCTTRANRRHISGSARSIFAPI